MGTYVFSSNAIYQYKKYILRYINGVCLEVHIFELSTLFCLMPWRQIFISARIRALRIAIKRVLRHFAGAFGWGKERRNIFRTIFE